MSQNIPDIQTCEEADAWMDRPEPTWLFKHSNTCGFTGSKWQLFCRFIESASKFEAARVVVQDHRAVSDHMAERLGVRHETPQALLVCGGKVLWDASHTRITDESLAEAEQVSP